MAEDNTLEREQVELEKQKFALDQDKLQWEKDKATAEDQKYAAESERRAADLAKARADAEKAELEAADLRIPFKDRPAYRAQKYQMIVTAAAIISLLVSFGTIKPALDAYFAEKNAAAANKDADAAKAGKAAAIKEADDAKEVAKTAGEEARETESHLDNMRMQVVPLEEQAEAATKKRIQAEHDLDFAKHQVEVLATETKRLEGTKAELEKQVGSLSRAEAYQRLQASISDSSTRVTQLLATRMRDSLSPDGKPEDAPNVQQIYQRLQDNVNYVALARSLAQLFTAAPESNPMTQPWKFTYSMTDVHARVNRDDVGETFSVLTTLNLLSLDRAVTMQETVSSGPGHRYFQITGDITIPLRDSPFIENGHARSKESFIKIYRRNLAAYIEESQKSFRGPGTTYRTKVLTDDRLWNRMAEIGNPAAYPQAIPEISEFEAPFIGSEYMFVVFASEKLARLSDAVYATTQAIQSGNADAYAAALNRLLAALLPFQRSEHYFETTASVPWLLMSFDDVTHRKMELKADCDITGLPRLQLTRP